VALGAACLVPFCGAGCSALGWTALGCTASGCLGLGCFLAVAGDAKGDPANSNAATVTNPVCREKIIHKSPSKIHNRRKPVLSSTHDLLNPASAPVSLVQVTVTEVFRPGRWFRCCFRRHAVVPGTPRPARSSDQFGFGRNRPRCLPVVY